MRGPIPRPESELARPRARKGGDQQEVTIGERRSKFWPDTPAHWGGLAAGLYEAAQESGQEDFYQQSDIATLMIVCEEINSYMEPDAERLNEETGEIVQLYPKRSGQMFQALMSSLGSLLLTEGDRRRVRLELQEPPREQVKLASVAQLHYADIANG